MAVLNMVVKPLIGLASKTQSHRTANHLATRINHQVGWRHQRSFPTLLMTRSLTMVIPITEGKRRRNTKPTPTKAAHVPTSKLTNYRIREIVPKYRDVEIRCSVSEMLKQTGTIRFCEDVVSLFSFLSWETRENFYALHLDTKNRILCLDQVSLGSLSSSIVHIRDVYKSVLISSAAAAIFVHNHPSGDPMPSAEDKTIHERLTAAGELLGIRVLDHLIIGRDGAFESLVYPGIGVGAVSKTLPNN